MAKLWQKGEVDMISQKVEKYTVGDDSFLDNRLAQVDILGSLAHTKMLSSVGLLSVEDYSLIEKELKQLYKVAQRGELIVEEHIEDIHSEVEELLTNMIGDAGKKIHSGRSRNDQVLLDMRLYLRREIKSIVDSSSKLFVTLQKLSEKYKKVLMPGYTHLQIAMPSSFGLWLGAYAESLVDDMQLMLAAYKIINRNPLGSAAGYGSSFPLNRTMTTELLGFDSLDYNSIYAQMGRGRSERVMAMALQSVAQTLGRLAMDNTLFLSQNFSFISYPDNLTTGSSIMPHKKNPDVWEIMRGKMNIVQTSVQQITSLMTNLPLGYNRDLQLLKSLIMPSIDAVKDSIEMADFMLQNLSVREDILSDDKYNYIFSVEKVNDYVLSGMPFREAYRKVGEEINHGEFKYDHGNLNHTHEGSIGNLCTKEVKMLFDNVISNFNFDKFVFAEEKLVK